MKQQTRRLWIRPVALLGALSTTLLAISVVSAGCSVVNDVDTVQPPAVAGDCDAGEALCEGACIDVTSDAANCGICGNSCPDGVMCVNGSCDVSCAGAEVRCSDGCVDVTADPAHCGRCGNACVAGANQVASCASGGCSVACADGFADCNGDASDGCEVDINTDGANCGGCGSACFGAANQLGGCADGVCSFDGACVDGFGDCDADMENGCETRLVGNNASCGGCGTVCTAQQYCATEGSSSSCQPLKIYAAEALQRQGTPTTFDIFEINLGDGTVVPIGTAGQAVTSLGFFEGALLATSSSGLVNVVDLSDGSLQFFADVSDPNSFNDSRAGLGITEVGGRLIVCSPFFPIREVDPQTGGYEVLSSGFCGGNSSLVSDGTTLYRVTGSRLETLDDEGAVTNTQSFDDVDRYHGATFHLGQLYALRLEGRNDGSSNIVNIDVATGTVTNVVTLTTPNRLHSLASPRPTMP